MGSVLIFLHLCPALMKNGVDWIRFQSYWTNGDAHCQGEIGGCPVIKGSLYSGRPFLFL